MAVAGQNVAVFEQLADEDALRDKLATKGLKSACCAPSQ